MTASGRALLALALLLALIRPAFAHKASDSFLAISVDGAAVTVRWDIALRDLDAAVGLDEDGDGAITWGEVRRQQPALAAHAGSRLTVAGDGAPCPLAVEPALAIAEHSDGHYAVLTLRGTCAAAPARLGIDYALLFDLDVQHRGLLKLAFDGRTEAGVFAPDRRRLTFESGRPSRVFGSYFNEGLWHVWLGADHMLFLAGLFLPAVLRRQRGGGWQPAASLPAALRETAMLVTAFTLAHALTLALAASGTVNPPSRLVESLVAASELFAGLNNLLPLVQRRLVWLAAGFGLIHGAAIAGALLELGLPTSGRVTALLAFNLGVELAQLALVALVVPLCFRFRHAAGFRHAVLVPGSMLVALAGLGWLLQRALGLGMPMPF